MEEHLMAKSSENLPKTSMRSNSPEHFLLNAGAVVHNLEWSSDQWTYEEFGATSGGSTLTLNNTLRQMEIDGVFATPVGGDQVEASEGTMELNLLEYTAENISHALIAEVTTADGTEFPSGYNVVTPSQRVTERNYIKNLAYIGTYGESELPIIIIFDYAISTEGISTNPQDSTDNVITMTFSARTSPERLQDSALPVRILVPQTNTVPGS